MKIRKEREKKKKGKKRQNARKARRFTTRIISMQLYNYNTFVHQVDAINKTGKSKGSIFAYVFITGYDNLRICYIRRGRPAAVGPSSDSEKGQAEILTDVS